MDQRRHGSSSNRRRRRRYRHSNTHSEPELIAARRPAPPREDAAPAVEERRPASERAGALVLAPPVEPEPPALDQPRRAARIVRASSATTDAAERQRQRLLDRLLTSQGRLAITRAAREYQAAGFAFPIEQEVQLQLLEYVDEELVRSAIRSLTELLESQEPIKKPVLDQRLKGLEEYADEPATREAAAELRRLLRMRANGSERRVRVDL